MTVTKSKTNYDFPKVCIMCKLGVWTVSGSGLATEWKVGGFGSESTSTWCRSTTPACNVAPRIQQSPGAHFILSHLLLSGRGQPMPAAGWRGEGPWSGAARRWWTQRFRPVATLVLSHPVTSSLKKKTGNVIIIPLIPFSTTWFQTYGRVMVACYS